MTSRNIKRSTLESYARVLGRNSIARMVLDEYDAAPSPKPRIVMTNNGFRLEKKEA